MPEASEYDDFLRPILGSVSMAAFAEGVASETGSAEAEEAVSKATLKSAHKAIATALAEAKAQATRDAFEEAAREIQHQARSMRMAGIPCDTNEIKASTALSLAAAIRALATAPAETGRD